MLVRDRNERQFWIVTAERADAGRFVVQADEKLTAFLELELVIRRFLISDGKYLL
jgi:hypothetical protein